MGKEEDKKISVMIKLYFISSLQKITILHEIQSFVALVDVYHLL